jgi:hypothetical protein
MSITPAWTLEETAYARELVLSGLTFQQVADKMGRTPSAVGTKMWKIGMTGVPKRGKIALKDRKQTTAIDFTEHWDPKDEGVLVDLWYNGVDMARIVTRTGKSEESVLQKAKQMCLHDRSEKDFRKTSRGRRFRSCCSCGGLFMSEGAGNRLCGCADTGGYNDFGGAGCRSGIRGAR